jgi:quercetin dioxygenase-like cupin family protein
MTEPNRLYHVQRAHEIRPAIPEGLADHASGLRRAELVGRHVGSVHTGFALVELEPDGRVQTHLHSTEQSFYMLEGNPTVVVDGRAYRLAADECGLLPVGVPHAWLNRRDQTARWVEVNAPAPRLSGPPDTFWTGEPVDRDGERGGGGSSSSGGGSGGGSSSSSSERGSGERGVDIRDPRTRTFFRLGPGEMDLENLKVGAAVDAPMVSASMATALLAYSGIAVKMLVDTRLGAALHTMFMVEYQPGGVAQPHDHPFEETYYMLSGEVDAVADGETFTLRPGDVFWTGVGCVHAFYNRSDGRVRWLETQSPQPPANYSYRFNRDWDYLAERLQSALTGGPE